MKMYCLLASGKPLTDQVRDALVVNAYEMWNEKKRRQRIRNQKYDGMITTDKKTVNFCGMSGQVFESTIDVEGVGTTQVRFLLRTSDLEDGFLERASWASFDDLSEQCRIARRNYSERN